MRREFSATYEQAISLIKQLKNSNDHLNRAIGVEPHHAILARLNREQPIVQTTSNNIEDLIQKLQQSYLDPDTARKIGTAKQQFRIQRDRRNQLLQSANYDDTPLPQPKNDPPSLVPSQQQPPRNNGSTWHRFTHKQSEQTCQSERQEEVYFQMQRRLMNEKNQEINVVAQSIMNVHNILQETAVLTHEQGEQIDIIGEELFSTYRNVNEASENVAEANESQQRARRKYVYLSMIILVVLAVAAIALFV